MGVLKPGETCWRVAHADRVAFLVDTQDYFTAAYEAMVNAQSSILLLGWGFDPRTRLAPDGANEVGQEDEVGQLLTRLAAERSDLKIRLLIWKSALPVSATQEFFPHKARKWFRHTNVEFELDDAIPLGACHHQKVLVIDEKVAFVGGGDICSDRWDSTAHLDCDLRRRLGTRECHSPRHEVMMMVDGAAAAALGDLARERWLRSTRRSIDPHPGPEGSDPWPSFVKPDMQRADVAIARTLPNWKREREVREIADLTLASIRAARKTIYLENQYFTSAPVAEALAARLAEPDGPEVVLISTHASPSWFDQLTMDRVRGILIRRLRQADVFGRFQVFSPRTPGGDPVIVHAKVCVIDDEIVRIGSANINNRSAGFDTECELAIEACNGHQRKAIAAFRDSLLGHYMGRRAADVHKAGGGSLVRAIENLNVQSGRLVPITPKNLTRGQRVIADFHLGDPRGTGDAMRPYKRRRILDHEVRSIAAEGGMMRFIRSLQNRLRGEDGRTPFS